MIDISCGDKLYETMFAPFVKFHLGFEVSDIQHSLTKIDAIGKIFNVLFVAWTLPLIQCNVLRY
jgi:hypothetical protein